jgi:hypothetical protein
VDGCLASGADLAWQRLTAAQLTPSAQGAPAVPGQIAQSAEGLAVAAESR